MVLLLVLVVAEVITLTSPRPLTDVGNAYPTLAFLWLPGLRLVLAARSLSLSLSHSLTLTHSWIIETAGARSSQQSKRAATQRRRLLRFLLLLRFARSRAGALPRP